MELHIHRGSVERTVMLVLGNLILTAIFIAGVVLYAEPQPMVNPAQVLLESVSSVVAFALFAAAALVQVSIARMYLLFAGLYLFQLGRIFDVLDEMYLVGFDALSTAGEVLSLSGEILLAMVAFHFVSITKAIASTDRLTGLSNKAHHQRRMRQALDELGHEPARVAVVALDLDKFKLVNDRHGHGFGDQVLKHVAALLTTHFKSHRNVVSRTGGEEFEILLTKTSHEAALAAAEEARALIETHPPQGLERLTASVGVAVNEPRESAISLRKRADGAAYMAKQSGRNRVCFASLENNLPSNSAES